jgi:hypothetical protein
MDLLAIRQALADVVAQVVETAYPHPRRSMTYPCAVIEPQPGVFVSYLKAMHQGLVEVNLKVTFLASLGDDEGTARISSWLSTGNPESVSDILRVDKTLGGLVSDLVVPRAENAGWIEIPPGTQTWFASAELAVDIHLPQ